MVEIETSIDEQTDILLLKPGAELVSPMPPLGLGYLSSIVKEKGIDVKILNCGKEGLSATQVADLIREKRVKIVGVTACSNDHLWLDELAHALVSMPEVVMVAGGPHPTGLAGRLFDLIPRLDYIIQCEGEEAFPPLVSCLLEGEPDEVAKAAIPNLIWRRADGTVVTNEIRLPSNLDALPMPDWEQLSPVSYAPFVPHGGFSREKPVGQVITTRGCPYGCRYCAGHVINGRKIRRRSANNIADEMEYLVREHGVREIHIEDDNFTFYKEHVLDLCAEIRKRGLKVHLGCPNGVRIDKLDDEILSEMKSAGFYFFSVGIESGSPKTLKRMQKKLDLEKIPERLALIRNYGIQVKGFFIIGYPGETAKDIEMTIELARSLDLDQAFFGIYIPLPGTPDYEDLERDGDISLMETNWHDYFTSGFSSPPYVPSGMKPEELTRLLSKAYRSFYFRKKIVWKLIRRTNSIGQIRHLVSRGSALIVKTLMHGEAK